ncbi:penicillin-binding protein 2 [Agromyces protaetiae]|uniref:Penicillin-binding protein 2 n=1 Tax=Agromyces protaetiae TaxID=2509455 RepID=A0A4P6FDI6_9MICO|nr:penicillin-binding protein 2 [Agromyces protaetiae]QAY74182.1 penicillin-binding protein 2 [Agromyces protaetiae]
MRRVIVTGFALVALVGVFLVRLVDIQVVRAAEFNEQAEDVRSRTTPVWGERGEIVDATGTVLADSVMRYDIVLSPKQARSKQSGTPEVLTEYAGELGGVLGMKPEDIIGIIDSKLAEDPDSDYAYVKKQVDTDVYEKVRALKVPWVYTEEHPGRRYPNGAVAGNLLGFMGDEGEAQAGLELAEDQCLAGSDGELSQLRSLSDWVTIPGSERVVKQAKNGGTLKLTIDADLQFAVQRIAEAQVQATQADWATVTVMEAKTGKILAIADVPTVDPNNPTGVDAVNRGSRAFTAPYEPGSTFKALTAASVVDAGKSEPGVIAGYRIKPDGADINDSFYHDDERYTLTGVLIDSSNTGMSLFGERLTSQQRYDYMKKFGLGEASEVGFPGEETGDLHGGPELWDSEAQTRYATMFGQGLTTTAVQIASVYQTIANGGVRMPVTLVEGCTDENGKVTEKPPTEGRQVVSAQAASQTSQMLENVYTHGWLRDTWKIPGYRVAAKTGTAQVPDGQGGYQHGYLVSVSGFAPADDPKYVVSVSIMNPVKMNSSAASAPVFRDVMSQVLIKYRTVPSGAPAPELPATW